MQLPAVPDSGLTSVSGTLTFGIDTQANNHLQSETVYRTMGKWLKGVYPVYGGTWPAITWRNFMSAALAKVPATPFTQPAPITPPVAAPELQQHGPPTTAVVEPGPADLVQPTPAGGPYRIPAPTPV